MANDNRGNLTLAADNALLRAEIALLRERLRIAEGGRPPLTSQLSVQNDNIVWGT